MRLITALACAIIAAACRAYAQEPRIVSFDSSGALGFAVSSTNGVSNFVCGVEWCSSLGANWSNSWHASFAAFPQSNGMLYAGVPRFYRIVCSNAPYQTVTNRDWTNYNVVAVVTSYTADGRITWTNSGADTNTSYQVEHATSPNGVWWGQWAHQTNLPAATNTVVYVNVPLFFRVVRITTTDGGAEDPFP